MSTFPKINVEKILFLSLFFLIIIPINIFGETNLDSLLTNINHLNDKEKLKRYLQIEEHFYENSDSLTIRYYKISRPLSQKIGNDQSFIKSKEILANYYFKLALYSKTIELLKPTIEYRRFNENNRIFDNYAKIIESYYRIGIYNKAIEYYYAGKIFIKPKDKLLEARVQYIIGDIYLKKEKYNKAKKMFLSSMEIFKAFNNTRKLAKTYDKLAEIYSIKKDYKKAIYFAKKSLKKYKHLINKDDIGLSELKLSEYYLDSKDIHSSEKHIFKAYNLFVNVHNNHSLANLFNKMAKLYFLKKDYSKSEIYVLKSLKILENLVDNQI